MLHSGRRRPAVAVGLAALFSPVLASACTSSSSAVGATDAVAPLDGGRDSTEEDSDDASDDAPEVVPDALPFFSDPFGGEVGCDAAFRSAFSCTGEILLHGGISDVLYPYGCGGTTAPAMLDFLGEGRTGAHIEFVVTFASALVLGTAGVQPAATVAITCTGGDAGAGSWTTPTGACTVTFDSNVCLPGATIHAYGVSGTGSCSQPAGPTAGTLAPPILIPGFSFSAHVSAPTPDAG